MTIRSGAMWNTTPPRQVNAADVVRGLKRSCNPTQPFGGQPDFEAYRRVRDLLQRVRQGRPASVGPGLHRRPPHLRRHGLPVDRQLQPVQPATYFPDMLTLPPFPRPRWSTSAICRPAALAQHTISDGPYEISSYDPAEHRLRAQPGVEGQHRPAPQGLRQ